MARFGHGITESIQHSMATLIPKHQAMKHVPGEAEGRPEAVKFNFVCCVGSAGRRRG